MTEVERTASEADTENAPHGSAGAEPAPMKKRVLKATGWTTLGHGLVQIIRLGSSLILTRLLLPEVYGLMELVYVFYTGLVMFSDLGLEANIIQSRRGDETRFLNTAWTIQVLRGGLLFAASLLFAQPVAGFYNQPELVYLISAIGVTALIDGFYSTAIFTESRRLNIGSVVRLEVAMQLIVVGVQVMVALIWPSVWSLVIGGWTGSLAKLIGSHYFLRSHRHRLDWEPAAARELFNFGGWIFLSTALSFLSTQGDRLILGRLLTMTDLGVYAIATRLRYAVQALHSRLVRAVLLPVIAEKDRELGVDNPLRFAELSALYYRARLRLDAVFVTGAGVLMSFGYTLISILYADEYHAAGRILQVLSIEIGMNAALWSTEAILTGIGETKHYFVRSLGRAIFVLVSIPLGWFLFGFWGVVWAVALTEVPTMFIYGRELYIRGLLNPAREALAIVFFLVGILMGFLIDLMIRGS